MSTVKIEVEAPKLREAKELGQLVAATSANSRYVVVLLSKSLNMAVRVLSDSVSLRVEPVDHETFSVMDQTALAGIGFAVHSNKDYASVHFPLTGLQAAMAIGAMIAGVCHIVGGKAQVITTQYVINDLPGKGS